MSPQFTDFSHDQSKRLLYKIALKFEMPDYVRRANPEDLASECDPTKCALLLPEPQFPTHNKAATWLSYSYFNEQQHEMHPADREKCGEYLKKRAEFWKIATDLDAVDECESKLAAAAADTDEAFPVRNVKEALAAEAWLHEELALPGTEITIPISDRIKLAREISRFTSNYSNRVRNTMCRSGCYDGHKVAESIRSAYEDHPVALNAADICEKLTPTDMHAYHGKLAIVLEKIACVDELPENVLHVNTHDPVVFLKNGAVAPLTDLTSFSSPALDAAIAQEPLLAPVRDLMPKVAENMMADMADAFCHDMKRAGFNLVVDRPNVAMSTLRTDLTDPQ